MTRRNLLAFLSSLGFASRAAQAPKGASPRNESIDANTLTKTS